MHEVKDGIRLGFEIPGGKEVEIFRSHLMVTGLTQLSGKTTTLEALAERSGLRVIVFKTKPGEKSFSNGTKIAPFFRDRSDYEFVKSLIEAYAKEKLFLEKGTLMTLCKGSNDLLAIKQRVDEALHPTAESKKKPPTGLKEEIYVRLEHYLENLIPQIKYANFSSVLNLTKGINIMELGQFSEEAQSLIIQSTADEVLKKEHGVIIIIPEAWKFIPQRYNNPCKRSVEAFIRQGAVNKNYIWIDSQDMSGVDKTPLKSVSTWILGYQRERNEVKHTLDQISLPKKSKPKEEDIMNLRKGQFFVSSYEGVKKVYVQPVWLGDEAAIKIAKGKMDVEEAIIANSIVQDVQRITDNRIQNEDQLKYPAALSPKTEEMIEEWIPKFKNPLMEVNPSPDQKIDHEKMEMINAIKAMRSELNGIRTDFFEALSLRDEGMRTLGQKIFEVSQPKDTTDEVVAKVLQQLALKAPVIGGPAAPPTIDEETLIQKVLARVPKGEGTVTYELAPLEMIKRKFIQEAKDKILGEIGTLSADAKKVMKFIESRGVECTGNEIATKALLLDSNSGNDNKATNAAVRELVSIGVAFKHPKNSKVKGLLRERIEYFLKTHDAKPEEIENLYNHIVVELLK